VPLKKAIEATSKPAPSKQRAQPSYWDLVREIEASVCNPPPCEIGMTVDCTAWLEQNAKQSDVVTLPCGLSYKVLAHGREKAKKSPKLNTPVLCHYRGFLHDGTEFDSSYGRGQPYEFVPANMIQGWTVAMQLMAEGDTWELYVPAQLAYGDAGAGTHTGHTGHAWTNHKQHVEPSEGEPLDGGRPIATPAGFRETQTGIELRAHPKPSSWCCSIAAGAA
jgi:FKBP-type peptidyl-prolyl cis-trans isomerase FklB